MTVIEYGKQNAHTLMLLHGGELSWWNYREAAKGLKDYHVILPGLRHGELSINQAEAYTQILKNWIRGNAHDTE